MQPLLINLDVEVKEKPPQKPFMIKAETSVSTKVETFLLLKWATTAAITSGRVKSI